MDTVEDSSNDANRPEAHTTRMVTALTIQTVATTMPPGSFMGPGTISYDSTATFTRKMTRTMPGFMLFCRNPYNFFLKLTLSYINVHI